MQWFYHDLAGIQMDTAIPGWKQFVIRPTIVSDLTEVKGTYHSLYGKIVSERKRVGNELEMHVVVPPNTTADVHIPAKVYSSFTENGQPLSGLNVTSFMSVQGQHAVVKCGSGEYRFVAVIQW